ncbi:unnamed protein product [Orchesella dallaii]|uniref:Uncharacterized protein n=1 Tax=Orchesella dallaii TaxID=48710 RepID=A0ABP1QYM8_9HEXA
MYGFNSSLGWKPDCFSGSKMTTFSITCFVRFNADPVICPIIEDIIKALCENPKCVTEVQERFNPTIVSVLSRNKDMIYINKEDATPNLFRVGNGGVKSFHGGKGKNVFLLSGTCTSELKVSLVGGASEFDTATITENCGRGSYLTLDFQFRLFGNYIRLELRSPDGKMSLKSIEQVNGRKNEGEELRADCFIRKVALQEGN